MDFKNLVIEKQDRIGIIAINRPEVRNAINADTWAELERAIDNYINDQEVEVVILTGKGEKAFAAGADINALLERSMVDTISGKNQAILAKIESMPKPVIAAVNGFSLGGGCELAMSADIRIASENAKFGLPELNLGIIPGAGGTQRLARLVGFGRAKEMILTGRIIDAEEAREIGLVSKVVPSGMALDSAIEMAQEILKKGPLAVRMAKLSINVGTTVSPEAGFALELMAQGFLFGTEDHNEGLRSFLEKRKANFQKK